MAHLLFIYLHYSLSIHSLRTSTGNISHFRRLPCSVIFLTGVLWVLLEWQSVPFFCYANMLTLFSLSGRGSQRKDVLPHHALLSLVDYKYCKASRRRRQISELAPDYKPCSFSHAFPCTVWHLGCYSCRVPSLLLLPQLPWCLCVC